MLRSLYSGISGLRSHQTMLDVTGNNIANVNTTAFKSSAVQFQDTLSQLVRGAGGAQAETGGTNPAQIGLGVLVAGISTNFTQGAAQATGRSTDMMINGDGFFVMKVGGETVYTRAGSLDPDSLGRLVGPGGAILQGWNAVNGVIQQGGNPFEAPRMRDYPLPPLTPILSSEMFSQAATNAGYHPFPRPSANASEAYTNPDGSKFGACQYCGYCQRFGCEANAKGSPHITVIPIAMSRPNFQLRRSMARPVGVCVLSAIAVSYLRCEEMGRHSIPERTGRRPVLSERERRE